MRTKTPLASKVSPTNQVGFCVTFTEGLPCVDLQGFKYYQELLQVSKQQAIRLGRSLYFVCSVSKKVFLLKYAEEYRQQLVHGTELKKILTAEEKRARQEDIEVEKMNAAFIKAREESLKVRIQNAELNFKFQQAIADMTDNTPPKKEDIVVDDYIMDKPIKLQSEFTSSELAEQFTKEPALAGLFSDKARKKYEIYIKTEKGKKELEAMYRKDAEILAKRHAV